MGRKKYGADKIGKVRALYVSNAGYVKPTAAAEQVSRDTVRRWAGMEIPSHVTAEEVNKATAQASEELAKMWERAATLGAQGVVERLEDEEARGKIGAKDLALVAAIATDKRNLLTGGATERVEVLDFASWLTRQRAQTGTTPHLEEPKTEERVSKQN